jgi:hypothetical protein
VEEAGSKAEFGGNEMKTRRRGKGKGKGRHDKVGLGMRGEGSVEIGWPGVGRGHRERGVCDLSDL